MRRRPWSQSDSVAALATAGGVWLLIEPRRSERALGGVAVSNAIDNPQRLIPNPASPESGVPNSATAPQSSLVPPAAHESPAGEPLDNKPWLKLVEESVTLLDELDRHRADFDAPRQDLADHVICRLQEILERCGVDSIDGDHDFDRNRHQPEGRARLMPGAKVTATLSPGFRVGKRVLRRARVLIEDPASAGPSG